MGNRNVQDAAVRVKARQLASGSKRAQAPAAWSAGGLARTWAGRGVHRSGGGGRVRRQVDAQLHYGRSQAAAYGALEVCRAGGACHDHGAQAPRRRALQAVRRDRNQAPCMFVLHAPSVEQQKRGEMVRRQLAEALNR